MEMRTGVGWQYALSDLSLILFMISAAALAKAGGHGVKAPPAPPVLAAPVVADPVAVWRPGPGAPGLGAWLASTGRDARQRLTIVARYSGANATLAATNAARLLAEAGPSAGNVRIVVEPDSADDLSAALTWDVPDLKQGPSR
ncbi:MAG: hypothetical protein ABJA20_08535 [Novosphingobium sp.]